MKIKGITENKRECEMAEKKLVEPKCKVFSLRNGNFREFKQSRNF